MAWWVYENWTHDRARSHRGDCGYCNHGRGTQPSDSGRNGQWRGEFSSQELALKVAKGLNRAEL